MADTASSEFGVYAPYVAEKTTPKAVQQYGAYASFVPGVIVSGDAPGIAQPGDSLPSIFIRGQQPPNVPPYLRQPGVHSLPNPWKAPWGSDVLPFHQDDYWTAVANGSRTVPRIDGGLMDRGVAQTMVANQLGHIYAQHPLRSDQEPKIGGDDVYNAMSPQQMAGLQFPAVYMPLQPKNVHAPMSPDLQVQMPQHDYLQGIQREADAPTFPQEVGQGFATIGALPGLAGTKAADLLGRLAGAPPGWLEDDPENAHVRMIQQRIINLASIIVAPFASASASEGILGAASQGLGSIGRMQAAGFAGQVAANAVDKGPVGAAGDLWNGFKDNAMGVLDTSKPMGERALDAAETLVTLGLAGHLGAKGYHAATDIIGKVGDAADRTMFPSGSVITPEGKIVSPYGLSKNFDMRKIANAADGSVTPEVPNEYVQNGPPPPLEQTNLGRASVPEIQPGPPPPDISLGETAPNAGAPQSGSPSQFPEFQQEIDHGESIIRQAVDLAKSNGSVSRAMLMHKLDLTPLSASIVLSRMEQDGIINRGDVPEGGFPSHQAFPVIQSGTQASPQPFQPPEVAQGIGTAQSGADQPQAPLQPAADQQPSWKINQGDTKVVRDYKKELGDIASGKSNMNPSVVVQLGLKARQRPEQIRTDYKDALDRFGAIGNNTDFQQTRKPDLLQQFDSIPAMQSVAKGPQLITNMRQARGLLGKKGGGRSPAPFSEKQGVYQLDPNDPRLKEPSVDRALHSRFEKYLDPEDHEYRPGRGVEALRAAQSEEEAIHHDRMDQWNEIGQSMNEEIKNAGWGPYIYRKGKDGYLKPTGNRVKVLPFDAFPSHILPSLESIADWHSSEDYYVDPSIHARYKAGLQEIGRGEYKTPAEWTNQDSGAGSQSFPVWVIKRYLEENDIPSRRPRASKKLGLTNEEFEAVAAYLRGAVSAADAEAGPDHSETEEAGQNAEPGSVHGRDSTGTGRDSEPANTAESGSNAGGTAHEVEYDPLADSPHTSIRIGSDGQPTPELEEGDVLHHGGQFYTFEEMSTHPGHAVVDQHGNRFLLDLTSGDVEKTDQNVYRYDPMNDTFDDVAHHPAASTRIGHEADYAEHQLSSGLFGEGPEDTSRIESLSKIAKRQAMQFGSRGPGLVEHLMKGWNATKAEATEAVRMAGYSLQSDKRSVQDDLFDGGRFDADRKPGLFDEEDDKQSTIHVPSGGNADVGIPLKEHPTNRETPAAAHFEAVPGASKFVQEDVLPKTVAAIGGIDQIRRDFGALFNPAGVSAESGATARSLRANAAKLARDTDAARSRVSKLFKAFDQMPEKQRLDFIDAMETGANLSTPEETDIANTLRELTNEPARELAASGKMSHFIENYVAHYWKERTTAGKALADLFGKRPAYGSQAFRKQRTIPTIREGIDAGLTPLSTNPVELQLWKRREMQRFLMMYHVSQEERAAGRFKYFPVDADTPPPSPQDWMRLPDELSTVFGDPHVEFTEAVDTQVWNKLHEVIGNLDEIAPLQHLRKLGPLNGHALGLAHNPPNKMETMFGGDLGTAFHELGHIADFRYGVWKYLHDWGRQGHDGKDRADIDYRKKVAQELRDLADLRNDGLEEGHGLPKKYIRRQEEKVANAFEWLVRNPQRMGQVAPTIKGLLTDFVKSKPELHPLLDVQNSATRGIATKAARVEGKVIKGYYYARPEVARVIMNYLSPGLRKYTGFRWLLAANNVINQAQLGLSPFHAIFSAINSNISSTSLGLMYAADGNIPAAAKAIANGVNPLNTFFQLQKGMKLTKAWNQPGSPMEDVINAIVQGGGRAKMSDIYRTDAWQGFHNAVMSGNYPGALLRMPFATVDLLAKPMMEKFVPMLKLAALADIAQYELGRHPLTEEQMREQMAKAVDTIDDRFGQLVYDNLMWNTTLKDALMLGVRSLGWNIGTIRAGAGAAIDTLSPRERLGLGKKPFDGVIGPEEGPVPKQVVSHRMAYMMGLLMTTALIGAVLTYLRTGKKPRDVRDLLEPPTGRKTSDGSEERTEIPTYMKDYLAYLRDPGGTAWGKRSPFLSTTVDLIKNRDFQNAQIRTPDDPFLKQLQDTGLHIAKQLTPIGVERALSEKQKTGRLGIESMIGMTPAPATASRTKAMQRAYDFLGQNSPSGPRTPSDAASTKGSIAAQWFNGELTRDQLRLAINGIPKMSNGEKDNYEASLVGQDTSGNPASPLTEMVRKLHADQALKVYDLASPEERKKISYVIEDKLSNSKNLSYAEKDAIGRKYPELNFHHY